MSIIATYPVYAGYTKEVQIPIEVAKQSWNKLTNNTIEHVLNIETEIQFNMRELVVGDTYKFTYEVFDYIDCFVWMMFGANKGTVHSQNGIFTETITIRKEDDKVIKFVSDGKLKIRNLRLQHKIIHTDKIPFGDPENFENKSFTLSYDIKANEGKGAWASFHSYIPNYYISTPNNMYSYWRDVPGNSLYKHHEGLFGFYYGKSHDYIIELISLSNPLTTRTWEDITLQVQVKKYDEEAKDYIYVKNTIFDKVILYNSNQSSGELEMVVKKDSDDYLTDQTINKVGSIIISNNEHDWRFNDLRDHVVDYSKPLFSKSWNSIKDDYPIDKVVNEVVIDYLKNWYELRTFTDKYLAVRLIYSKFADKSVELTTNYTVENEQPSIR